MPKFSDLSDRAIIQLRGAVERERMVAHRAHNDYRRRGAAKKLKEIDNEISRRRTINSGNRKMFP